MSLDYEKRILSMIADNNSVNVADIAKILDVSAVTVRNYLATLEEKGLIVRCKGGALPAFHPSILERQRHRTEEKQRIARAAADMVHDGEAIMIEAGTTTALVTKYLLGRRDIHVVTNSVLLLQYARNIPTLHLTVAGGEFRPATESFVGSQTLRQLEEFHVATAFIGTDGFSLENGLTTHLMEGAEVVRKMVERADRVVLVADSAKYGRKGFVKVLDMASVHRIVTDSALPVEAVETFASIHVDVVRV